MRKKFQRFVPEVVTGETTDEVGENMDLGQLSTPREKPEEIPIRDTDIVVEALSYAGGDLLVGEVHVGVWRVRLRECIQALAGLLLGTAHESYQNVRSQKMEDDEMLLL